MSTFGSAFPGGGFGGFGGGFPPGAMYGGFPGAYGGYGGGFGPSMMGGFGGFGAMDPFATLAPPFTDLGSLLAAAPLMLGAAAAPAIAGGGLVPAPRGRMGRPVVHKEAYEPVDRFFVGAEVRV